MFKNLFRKKITKKDTRPMHRDWKELANEYAESAAENGELAVTHIAMSKLCAYIGASHMRNALFGHTSMQTLCISQAPVVFPRHPEMPWLRIEPVENDQIEFRLVDTGIKERQWVRVVDATDIVDRFKRLVEQLRWSSQPLS